MYFNKKLMFIIFLNPDNKIIYLFLMKYINYYKLLFKY